MCANQATSTWHGCGFSQTFSRRSTDTVPTHRRPRQAATPGAFGVTTPVNDQFMILGANDARCAAKRRALMHGRTIILVSYTSAAGPWIAAIRSSKLEANYLLIPLNSPWTSAASDIDEIPNTSDISTVCLTYSFRLLKSQIRLSTIEKR